MKQFWHRFAVIADIHSNVAALDAALADIHEQRCDGIVDLGDCVSGPLFPRETATRLMDRGIESLRGNHERQLTTLSRPQMGPSDSFADGELTAEQKTWIAGRPTQLELGGNILAIHGSPASDIEYLLETVEPEGCRPAHDHEVEARLTGVTQALVLCGHTHLQRKMHLADGRLIVNPGSIGLPAYADEKPFPHTCEAGSPHARYATIDRTEGGFRVEFHAVAYDWVTAARLAETRGRFDWGAALRTGRA
jgi:predicted phosphodiesterase